MVKAIIHIVCMILVAWSGLQHIEPWSYVASGILYDLMLPKKQGTSSLLLLLWHTTVGDKEWGQGMNKQGEKRMGLGRRAAPKAVCRYKHCLLQERDGRRIWITEILSRFSVLLCPLLRLLGSLPQPLSSFLPAAKRCHFTLLHACRKKWSLLPNFCSLVLSFSFSPPPSVPSTFFPSILILPSSLPLFFFLPAVPATLKAQGSVLLLPLLPFQGPNNGTNSTCAAPNHQMWSLEGAWSWITFYRGWFINYCAIVRSRHWSPFTNFHPTGGGCPGFSKSYARILEAWVSTWTL